MAERVKEFKDSVKRPLEESIRECQKVPDKSFQLIAYNGG